MGEAIVCRARVGKRYTFSKLYGAARSLSARKFYMVTKSSKTTLIDVSCSWSVIRRFVSYAPAFIRRNKPKKKSCRHPFAIGPDIAPVPKDIKKIWLDSKKIPYLKNLASRKDLTPAEQMLIARCALNDMDLDSSKVVVLTALINNPKFSKLASGYITQNISKLDLSSSQCNIRLLLSKTVGKSKNICYGN